MKKVIAVISSLILTASLLAGCGASSAPAATTAATPETQAPETQAPAASYKVAIVQQLDHSSLDEIRAAVAAELKAKADAAGVEITISEYNGQNDPTMLGQIGAQVMGDSVDMIIPIATLAAQTMVTAAEGRGKGDVPEYLLTHCQRYWAHGVLAPAERSVLPANKVVPQKLYFLSLFPRGNKDFFHFRKEKDI